VSGASTSTVPKKHHFVPQVLLRRFTDDRGRLEVFDIASGTTYQSTTKKAGAIVDFHTLIQEDGIKDRSTVEKRLSTIEDAGAKALLKIDSLPLGAMILGQQSKDALAEFVALQAVRTPDKRESNRSLADILCTAQLRIEYQQQGSDGARKVARQILGRDPSDDEFQKYQAIADGTSDDALDIGNNFLIQQMLDLVQHVRLPIASRRWIVLRHKKSWCFSSERPVILWSPRTKASKYSGIGFDSAQEIYFALDPRQLLVMKAADTWSFEVRTPTHADMDRIKERMALRSHQRIFLRPGTKVLRNLTLSNLPPALEVGGVRIDPNHPSWPTKRAEVLDNILR
jgi:hypothetical protein